MNVPQLVIDALTGLGVILTGACESGQFMRIYRDGNLIGETQQGGYTYGDQSLSPLTLYRYAYSVVETAWNHETSQFETIESERSPEAEIATWGPPDSPTWSQPAGITNHTNDYVQATARQGNPNSAFGATPPLLVISYSLDNGPPVEAYRGGDAEHQVIVGPFPSGSVVRMSASVSTPLGQSNLESEPVTIP